MTHPPAPRPCSTCPYRRDVPSGVWAADEYALLARYDAPTGEQPPGLFLCHIDDGRVCGGWAGCHDGRHLLALRFAVWRKTMTVEDVQATAAYVSPAPLFRTGAEAAAHGIADITRPGPEAIRAAERIVRTRRNARQPQGGNP